MSRSAVPEEGFAILGDLEKPYNPVIIFGNDNPVELEIGAGRGDFAVDYCAENPDRNLIAIERKLNYIKRGVNKTARMDLANIRFLNVEAVHFIEEYFLPETFAAVHIYFPDPWPKKKQKKRRILQPSLIDTLANRIVPGGYLHLRTDHPDYFEQMQEVMGAQTHFKPVEVPDFVSKHLTGFERRFRGEGIPINYASFELVR